MFVLFLPYCLSGTIFQYDNSIGRKYRIKSVIKQDVYINGEIKKNIESMVKALLEVTSVSNGYGFYKGKYEYYEKNLSSDDSYRLISEYDSLFFQDSRGKMIISSNVLMPDLRNVPTFPTNDLKPGDSWKSEGEEIHEGILSSNDIIISRFDVNYIYLGDEKINGVSYSKFSIDYHIMDYPDNDPNIFSVTGYSHLIYYWDITNQCPSFYNDDYNFLYTLRTGETVFYKSKSEGKGELMNEPSAEQKKAIVTEMTNAIVTNSGMSVRETPDGIILNLGNILFDFDKYTLKKEFENKLSVVFDVLKKYPGIDLSVSGFTDNIGEENYNLRLSENRAKTVADFLIKKGIPPSRLYYAGYGSSNPISSNNTEEGRSINRRVEIKIITKE
jgi:outer membrane protein OmpA-like peptidoglycan-associated protein